MTLNLGTATVLRADARRLPLADESVDLIVTSPPYFALRSYTDAGEHYAGQIGSEPSPQEFLDALLEVTVECARVLKPTGSLWVNLGDKYSDRAGPSWAGSSDRLTGRPEKPRRASSTSMAPRKSLLGLPWRYALRVIDDLGLILRQEIIWTKPNGLPESVTDRVRRTHEQWFHFTLQPRYFSAVDELREPYIEAAHMVNLRHPSWLNCNKQDQIPADWAGNPLGRLPGSVWSIATQPLKVPAELGVDHFAAFPTEWPRRIVNGWSPSGICTVCDEARRAIVEKSVEPDAQGRVGRHGGRRADASLAGPAREMLNGLSVRTISGYACSCAEMTGQDLPATRPAVVLDPFGGTGTTAMVAKALGRHGVTVDMSADYCRVAEWRTNDRDQLAKVLGIAKAEHVDVGDDDIFTLLGAGA